MPFGVSDHRTPSLRVILTVATMLLASYKLEATLTDDPGTPDRPGPLAFVDERSSVTSGLSIPERRAVPTTAASGSASPFSPDTDRFDESSSTELDTAADPVPETSTGPSNADPSVGSSGAEPAPATSTAPPPPTTPPPTTTLPTTAPPPTAADPRVDPVAPSDQLLVLDPRLPLSTQTVGQLMVVGQTVNSPLPDEVHGTATDSGATLRVGRVPDPDDPGRQVLLLGVSGDDPLRFDGVRSHIAHLNRPLPVGQRFWQTFSYRHNDWGGTSDKQLIMQWHDGDHSSGLSPFLAWYVEGSTLTISARWADVPNPSRADTKVRTLFREEHSPADAWQNYVVEGRIDPHGAGLLRIWRGHELIVDYAGPLGYDQPDHAPYGVVGYYHWMSGNPWDRSVLNRQTWWRWLSYIADPGGRYSSADVHAHLGSNINR